MVRTNSTRAVYITSRTPETKKVKRAKALSIHHSEAPQTFFPRTLTTAAVALVAAAAGCAIRLSSSYVAASSHRFLLLKAGRPAGFYRKCRYLTRQLHAGVMPPPLFADLFKTSNDLFVKDYKDLNPKLEATIGVINGTVRILLRELLITMLNDFCVDFENYICAK